MFSKLIHSYSEISGYIFNLKLKGFGISLIDSEPKEVIFIWGYDIEIMMNNLTKTNIDSIYEKIDDINLNISNFQIDYCLDNSYKVILSPKKQKLESNIKELLNECKKKLMKN